MSDIAIQVEKLGKQYRIGKRERYRTLRDVIADGLTAPVRRLRHGPANGSNGSEPETIWALKDVSFEVKHGEVVGIIGRNGAGKSTLLKILSRITEPTEGRARVFGRVGSLLEVGTGFHPELSGRENVYLNGAILGMKRADIERRFDEIVAFAEIEKFLDTPVKHYSSGMYVRLAFAVAAHMEPEILIVDEVLAVGDAAFQKKCLGKMGDVASDGRTVLFVSHNMTAIQELCPRVLRLENARIADDDSAQHVIRRYFTPESDLANGEVDISAPELRRSSMLKSRFRWSKITLINMEGKSTLRFAFGEPFDVVLCGVADADLVEIRVGIGFTSMFGVPIFNSFQDESGLSERMKCGANRFRIHIEPNIFAPGEYEISLRADGKGVIDFLPRVMQFSVAETGKAGSAIWQRHFVGVVHCMCKWHFEI